jgi:amino acid adenylation domain-containing protein
VTADAGLSLHEIPLLTEGEITRMLNEWNSTDAAYLSNRCIHQLFEDQVERTPRSVAVVFEGQQLTYSELNARANRIAHRIARSGAKEGAIVAVCVERGVDLIASLLAVSKTGATYLPLDPIYPKARLGLILEDAHPVLTISQQGLADKLPDTGTEILFLDQAAGLEKEPSGNLSSGNPLHTAYILYTSGSTGKPKGVQIRHHSVVNLVCSMGKLLEASASDTLLAVTTISFDIAQLEMYLPLFHGGKLVIATAETQMDPVLLKRKIEESGTTLFQATPVTFKMLALNSWKGKKDLKVICGGEAMSRELAASLIAGCRQVWNVYGPTETTIWSVVQQVSKEDTFGEGYVPIGKPLDNTVVYVLNPSLVPVPAGIAGELFIGGAGVSPGYLNLPEMTRDRFIPNPFSSDPEARIYRTGDLVRYGADGTLTFLNRMDSQVKIRGFRIELGEIESVLSQMNGIKENVVVAKEDASGEKFLAAYYIPHPGSETDEPLPDYMVPSAFVRMENFPLTANNKIDRKALPEPGSFAGQSSASYVKPSTLTEEKLARVWESVLKLDKAGIHDDFFESGGHSMIAVTLMIRIEKEFGIRLPLATLFEHSTIHGLAGIIDQQAGPVKWRSLVPIRPKGAKKPLFLIHGLGLNVLLYTTIINHLDPEQPVYGLQAKGLNGTDQPLETIEEIAAYYVSEIQTVDPHGPYSLAGFSLGGTIAFEMGRQLSASGKQVCFLGLLDSTAEGSVAHLPFMKRIGYKIVYAANYTGWNIASFFTDPDEDMLTVFKRRLRGLEKKVTGLDFKPEKNEMVSKGKRSELPGYLRRVHRANRKASRNYIFRPFSGTVHLFKATKQTFYIPDPDQYGWDKVARGGVIIHETPGEHSSTFAPPNDKYFATILQQCLNENNE